jgi:hypothetical protein
MSYPYFKNKIQEGKYSYDQISTYCKWEELPNPSFDDVCDCGFNNFMIATIVLSCFALLLIVYIIFTCYKKKKDHVLLVNDYNVA